MNFTVNSAALNGSSGSNLVVAGILSGLLVLAGTANATQRVNASAVNGNVGTVTTALANQQVASSSVGSVVVTGSASGIRYKVYGNTNDYLNTSGNATANYIANGSNSVELSISGSILANFKVDVELNSGSTELLGSVDPLRLKIVRCNPGTVSLQVDLITPNIVSITDLYVITSLNGYLIPANHLGYGKDGTLTTEMSCSAVRVVPVHTGGRLWEDGPQLVTNDAATLKHVGYLPTIGVTNVAVKIKPYNHFTWYYEDWLTLNIGSMEVVPRLFTGIVDAVGRITVTVTAEAIIRRAPKLNNVVSSVSGPSVTSILSAGSIASSLEFNLTGNSLHGVVIKEGQSFGSVTTSGNASGLRTVYFSAVNMFLDTVGNIVVNRARVFTSDAAELGLSGIALGYVNTSEGISSGNLSISGTTSSKVYKNSYATGFIGLEGDVQYNTSYVVRTSIVGTTGYCYSNKVVTETLATGVVTALNGPLDGRVVVKGDPYYGVSYLEGVVEGRIAVQGYGYSGELITSGVITPHYNETVYVTFSSGLTGNAFAITNLYVKAEESRSASIPSSPYTQNTSLHYIVIPE